MQASSIFITLACMLMSSACAAPSQERRTGYQLCNIGVSRTQDGTLRVCAPLNQDTLTAIQQEIKSSDTEVILTSDGGTSHHSMEIARLFNRNNIRVRARGFCLSGCSTYILLTARSVYIDPYTTIGFHHTGAFATDFMAERVGLPSNSPIRTLARDERAFFEEFGQNPSLLDRLSMAVEPRCFRVRLGPAGREGVLEYDWDLFVPSADDARTLWGERLTGYWPQSGREIQDIARASLGKPNLQVRYGWPEIAETDPAQLAKSLPNCT